MQIRRTTGFIALSLFIAFVFAACGGGGGGGGSSSTPVPEVVTASASSIGTDNAILNGTVNPSGLATTYHFEWGTSSTLATHDNTTAKSAGSGTAIVAVSDPITGLTQATTYYFRLVATNSSGTTNGAIVSVATASPMNPPTVQTNAADNLSLSAATLHASVIPNGLSTTAHFEWGTDSALAVPGVTPNQAVGSDTTSHQVNAVLTGLTTGTKYYYRIVGTNTAGTLKGLIASFDTNTLAPTVATVAASPVGTDNALLKGTVNPNGLATTYHFEWGTDSALSSPSSTPTLSAGSGTGDVSVSAQISSLADGTPYYYRVVATNSTATSQGSTRSFTTLLKPVPTAIAHFNESVYTMGPGTISSPATTVVTLDGSESTGSYAPLSFGWTQTAGTNTATLADNSASITTFTVPILDPNVSVADNMVFLLTVTDNKAQSGTDPIWKYVKWGYFDDFHTNSTAAYEVFDTWNTGGIFSYDAAGQRARIVAGATTGIKFQKTFTGDSKLIHNTGVFSFDFTPTAEAGSGGNINVRLGDGGAYLELSTADGMVRKVWPSTAVDEAAFVFPYASDGTTYHITINFSPISTSFTATGGGLTVGPVILTTNTNTLSPYIFEIDSVQQTSYFDNIKLEAAP